MSMVYTGNMKLLYEVVEDERECNSDSSVSIWRDRSINIRLIHVKEETVQPKEGSQMLVNSYWI